jgi:predicted dehydrogenase
MNSATLPTSPRRYALIGAGARAGLYIDAIAGQYGASARLVGLCDQNAGRLELARRRVNELGGGDPAVCLPGNFETMLAATGAQIVFVATPDANHHEYIVRAMNAGCDVISEKPLTTTPESCEKIMAARARTGRKCRVIFNLRYSPTCLQVKQLLSRGEIGAILSVDFHWMLDTAHGADYFRRWHSHKVNSGGLMIHKATHHFDLANWWIGGLPASVYATGKREFYTPHTARALGLADAHERCLTCPESDRCSFRLDLPVDPILRSLYLEQEGYDGYIRDRCVFRRDIDIEDNMNVLVRYDTGATLTYSLNAFSAWEGYTVAFNGTGGRLEYRFGDAPTAAGEKRANAVRLTIVPLRGAVREITPAIETGRHQGGDGIMLDDLLLDSPPPDPYLRAADERAGAAAALVGMAANRCFNTNQPVEIASLVAGLRRPDYSPMPSAGTTVPMPPHY